jgi:protein transport protein SEC24
VSYSQTFFSSAYDVREGMVATATRTILENLGRLPNEDQRTKVAIIAYDTSVYFFSMSVSLFDFSRALRS